MRRPERIIGHDAMTGLAFEGYAVVPVQPTPDAVAAWWRTKNAGGSDYDAYRSLVAVASGVKRLEDL